ncbi:MAG: hypothetical protein ACRDOI_03645, partial [Trebonia sp.]
VGAAAAVPAEGAAGGEMGGSVGSADVDGWAGGDWAGGDWAGGAGGSDGWAGAEVTAPVAELTTDPTALVTEATALVTGAAGVADDADPVSAETTDATDGGAEEGSSPVAACACLERNSSRKRIPAATIANCAARTATRRASSCDIASPHPHRNNNAPPAPAGQQSLESAKHGS